ncbi:MAG: hypothetical protein AB1673_07990 [Actinomycetota bacterium]
MAGLIVVFGLLGVGFFGGVGFILQFIYGTDPVPHWRVVLGDLRFLGSVRRIHAATQSAREAMLRATGRAEWWL